MRYPPPETAETAAHGDTSSTFSLEEISEPVIHPLQSGFAVTSPNS